MARPLTLAKPYKLITMNPYEVKPLLNKICSFLYKVYVTEQKWDFGTENPSEIRIERVSDISHNPANLARNI